MRNVGGEWEVGAVAFGVRGSNIPIDLKGIFRTKQKNMFPKGESRKMSFLSFFPNFRGMGYVPSGFSGKKYHRNFWVGD